MRPPGELVNRLGSIVGRLHRPRVPRRQPLRDIDLISFARSARQHLRVFGPIRGLALLMFGLLASGRLVSIRVPDGTGTSADNTDRLWLRLGTSDIAVADEVLVRGDYEFPDLPRPTHVVDAGANIGVTAVWLTRRYPGCRVIAIEPEPENYALLVKNVRNRPAITPVHAAVWPRPGVLGLVDPEIGAWGFQVREGERSPDGASPVRAMTITEVLDTYDIPHLDLLKLDIEGAEKDLFDGDIGFLERTSSVIVELHDRMRAGCARAFFTAVEEFDAEAWHGNNVCVFRSAGTTNPEG